MINIKGKNPTVTIAKELKTGDCFWRKRDQSLYTIP